MTFMLKKTGAATSLPVAEAAPSTFGETFRAGRVAEQIETDTWGYAHREAVSLYGELTEQLGPDYTPQIDDYDPIEGSQALLNAQVRAATEEINRRRQSDAVGPWQDLPATAEEFEDAVTERLRSTHEDASRVLENGGLGAEFLGRMWTGALDESTLMTLPFGVSGRLSVPATIGVTGAEGVAAEAMTLPRQYQMAERLGLPDPNPTTQLLMAGSVSGGLGGAVAGTQRALQYRQTKQDADAERRPKDDPTFEPERQAATQRAALDGRYPSSQPTTRTADAAPINLPVPENWAAIKNGIFAGESGGDYNALWSFQNRPGGRYENVRLTEMTVDDWIRFSNPSGEYGQWVKGQLGRVATPMGAYQVVGTTLRMAKKGLGLRGDEVMTEAMQDQIGIWIYRRQGTGAWEGYRGPRSEPVAGPPPDATAPDIAFRTSRGYTAQGQVLVGDDLRIDVDYEVVDLASLQQASGALQPRDRTRVGSDAWVADTAARLDPALLLPSPTADRGTPIVGPDSIIESGNGRARAITLAYDRFPDRAAAYRAQIEAAGYQIPEGVDRPVLIGRRTTDLDNAARRQMVVDAQDSGVARLTATERADIGQRALTADRLSRFEPGARLTDARNRDFARSFAESFPRSERNAFIGADGRLSTDGVRQIQDSLFARAWDAPDIQARALEGERGELRSLIDALTDAAPEIARLRADIDAGLVDPDMDITPFVIDAVRILVAAREAAQAGGTVSEAIEAILSDVDLFGVGVAPLTQALVRKMAPDGRQAPAAALGAFLSRYAAEARKAGRTGQADLGDAPGPLDVLQRIDPQAFGDLDEIGQRPTIAASRSDIDPGALDGEAYTKGTEDPLVQAADEGLFETFGQALDRELAEPSQPVAGNLDIGQDARALIRDNPDLAFDVPGSARFDLQDALDDLDADDGIATIVDACSFKGGN